MEGRFNFCFLKRFNIDIVDRMFMREVFLKNLGLYKCFNIFSWYDIERVIVLDRYFYLVFFEILYILENLYRSIVVFILLLVELV